MNQPFLDVGAAQSELRSEIDAAINRVITSGVYIFGEEVAEFEREYAEYCGTTNCVGVANGLDALHLILRALGIGPGDEVIVASNTYIATWLAVSMTGATPVPVEPDPATHNLDPAKVTQAITGATRALMPTHLYGQSADIDPLLGLASDYGLKLVEDAAQAHGARYKGRRLGGHGDAVAWSFYPGKNLGALGDGGAVTTNDPNLASRIRELANYGSKIKYINDVRGYNSRLDPLQAAVLKVKLGYLDRWNARRGAIAKSYSEAFADTSLSLPFVPNWALPAWHLYVVQASDRPSLAEALTEAGIQTLVHYPVPPHLQRAYFDLDMHAGDLPIAEALSKSVLSLPIGPQQSRESTDIIIREVRALTSGKDRKPLW